MNKFLTLTALILAGGMTLHAIPAKREYRQYTQPDGSTVEVMLIGDEFGHSYVTTDGIRLLPGADGALRYATVDAGGELTLSAMEAADPGRRSAEARAFISSVDNGRVERALTLRATERRKQRTPEVMKAPAKAAAAGDYTGVGLFTSSYPRTGQVRSLVFLVQFTDKKFTVTDPKEYYTRQLNKEGFAEYGATGSARDFFLEQSHGQFQPTFDVYGPVTLKNKMSYYGGNDAWGNDLRPEEMAIEAATAYAGEIDYSQYDFDNNGKIDNVYVIYAGLGEADGGSASTVWPHNWEIPNGPTFNGKKLYGYACSNEISSGVPVGIGTFCHEYSHVLGLPDLYPTRTSSYAAYCATPGEWSIMDSGSYNNDSRTPPAYSSYERNALGWLTPTVLEDPESVALESIVKSNTAYLVPTAQKNEFFLLENRQQESNDYYLPYHGMLIWHVDFDQSIWNSNIVNDNYKHNYVDIVKANNNPNNQDLNAMKGYPFPGITNNTSLTGTTTPAFLDWKSRVVDVPLTNIAEKNGVITFDAKGGNVTFDTPAAPTVEALDNGTVTVSWKMIPHATYYRLNVAEVTPGADVPFADYSEKNVGDVTSVVIDGVRGKQTYKISYRACSGNSSSDLSPEVSVTVPEIDFIYTTPVASAATSNGSNVLMSWEPMEGAHHYEVTVDIETGGATTTEHLTFGNINDMMSTIPADWSWTGKATDIFKVTSTGYFGESAPALKFTGTGIELVSPVYADNIQKVEFWLRGASATATSTFALQERADDSADWSTLMDFTPLNAYNSAGRNYTVTPETTTRQVRFVYTYKGGGNVSLDDVKLTYDTHKYVNDIKRANTGTATSYNYSAPSEASKVRFYVEAVDAGGRYSKPSNAVETEITSGIGSATSTASALRTDGRSIIYTGVAGDIVTVYTPAGSMAAQAVADNGGTATVAIAAEGIYIVATPAGNAKVIIR